MSAYIGTSRRVRDALMALATDVQYDTGAGPSKAFENVIGSNADGYDGSPNCWVLPGDVSMQRPTTHQSEPTLAFIMRIRLPMETDVQAQATSYNQMYDLTDLLIGAIEQSDDAESLRDLQGLVAVTMMNATRGDWLEMPGADGVTLICDVNVEITYSKSLS